MAPLILRKTRSRVQNLQQTCQRLSLEVPITPEAALRTGKWRRGTLGSACDAPRHCDRGRHDPVRAAAAGGRAWERGAGAYIRGRVCCTCIGSALIRSTDGHRRTVSTGSLETSGMSLALDAPRELLNDLDDYSCRHSLYIVTIHVSVFPRTTYRRSLTLQRLAYTSSTHGFFL